MVLTFSCRNALNVQQHSPEVVRAEPADTQSKEAVTETEQAEMSTRDTYDDHRLVLQAPAESKKPPADEKVQQKCTTEDERATA